MELEAGHLGDNVKLVCADDTCTVCRITDGGGEGLMTMYPIFPGCTLVYNDFHMSRCHSAFRRKTQLFCLDHCREGRIQWERSPGQYVYLSAGDLLADCREDGDRDFFFPLQHYHGAGLYVDLGYTDNGVLRLMDDFSVDLPALKKKLCTKNGCFVMRSAPQIDRIFSELYHLPDKVRRQYCRIKVMELFLFLDNLELPPGGEDRPYFYKSQVDKIQQMVALQTADLTQWYTLDQLSAMYHYPITGMKQCFKGIYGCTMAQYMKTYRMNTAARLLRTTQLPIIEIAAAVGYENPGKFSGAFRSCLGMTPSQYRKALRDT